MSYHTLSTKNSLNAGIKRWLKRGTHLGLGIGAFTPVLALANPTGGQVVAGHATIGSPSANGMVIDQTSQSAIINWQQFNIGKGQYVQFLQPSSSSVILNRVIGGGATSILGNLHGNGQVFLVNTNGVYFGKAATIDAQGFLASTLDIDDSDFLAHNYQFNKSGSNTTSDAAKTVVNDGSIVAHAGGYVVLAGDYSQNDGLISAQSGHIILASGAKSTLTLSGNGLVSYVVNQATLASLAGADNAGKLEADGGAVIMTADVANLLKATVVNNTGLIEARAISKAGGTIQLLASGGNINNAGTLDADANRSGLTGGTITLKGDERTTLTDTSKISALGEGADGGNLEISGNTISVRGTANLGHGGNLLLDPNRIKLITGNGGASHTHAGTAEGSNASVGTGFITTQLNDKVNVAISAHSFISHSANVHAISATKTVAQGGGGNLLFKTGMGGGGHQIALGGVTINITGNLTASMGYGGSFGHLTAKSIDMHANSPVTFDEDVVNSKGVITTFSAKATGGGITINAPSVQGSGEAGVALSATGGGIDITGNIHANGDLTLQGAEVEVDGSVGAGGAFKAVASNGHAHFGEVSAQNGINISATTTNASSDIVVNGTIQAYGGNVVLNDVGGGIVTKSISGNNITLTATGNDIRTGRIDGNGSVAVNAGTHNFSVSSGDSNHVAVFGEKGATITANQIHYTGTGAFGISGGELGGITVKGVFGNTTEGFSHALDLRADKSITLDHGINTHGDLTIEGAGLAFTGKTGSFSLSATGGDLTLEAPIGTAAAPVKYRVNLNDTSGGIFVRSSIFTADSIVAIQGHHGSDTLQGVLVGSGSNAVTLSATKDISLTGANVGIGAVRGGAGQVSLIAGSNVTLTAVGSSSHNGIGNVGIQAGGGEVNTGTSNHSILVQAGGNITIAGKQIDIHAGEIETDLHSGATRAVTGSANVTLKAGGNLDLTASGDDNQVRIDGGSLFGTISAAAHKTYTGNLNANVSLTAGKAMEIAASFVDISHGYGGVAVQAHGVSAVANLTQNANVSLKAGTTLTLTGNGSGSEAGVYINQTDILADQRHVQVQASSHGKASVTEHADVSFTAGTSINISGHQVRVSAGIGLASQSPGSGNHGVFGMGAGATATYTATADLNFKAGTGGITLSGLGSAEAGVVVAAGDGVAKHLVVVGDSGGKASASLHANLNMVTTGNVFVQGESTAEVHGANSAGYGVVAIGDKKGVAKLTVGGNVSISAKNFELSSGEANVGRHVGINGGNALGSGAGNFGPVAADSGGAVSITDSARVDIKVTGDIGVFGANSVTVFGGARAGASGGFDADAGKVSVSNDAGVSLNAGGDIGLFGGFAPGSSHSVAVAGGESAGNRHNYAASYGGTLTDTALSRVDITAGGSFTAHAATVTLVGGFNAGGSRSVYAASSGAGATKTTVVSDNSLNVTAGSIILTGTQVIVAAGREAGQSVTEVADGTKAVAGLTVNSGVNLTATKSFDITADTYMTLAGGFSAGRRIRLNSSSGHVTDGKATDTINAGLTIKAGSVLLKNTGGGIQSIGLQRARSSSGGHVGSSAGIHASGGGSANVTVNAGVSVTATGAFVASGADEILVAAAASTGRDVSVNNNGGVKVTDNLNNAITISAKSLTISAANSVEFFAGSDDVTNTRVTANGGTATMNVNSGLNLTAAQGITVNVTGTGGTSGTQRRIVLAGGEGALDINVDATHGGNAAIGLTDGITVKAGGAITLANTGVGATSTTLGGTASSIVNIHNANHGVFVVAGSRIGGSTEVQTGVGGGTAAFTADAGVNITTKGAFTADAGTGSLLAAGGSAAASNAEVVARASGKATATITQDLNITALSAAFSGGKTVLAGGFSDADQADVFGSHAGVATLNAETALRVTTTGALTIKGSEVIVTGGGGGSSGTRHIGGGFLGSGANVSASHGGQATLVATSTVQLKAASVTMSASTGPLQIFGGELDGAGMEVIASGKGDKATATLNGTVNITATTGGIKLTDTGTPTTASSQLGQIGIAAGSGAGVGEEVNAGGAGAAASVTLDTSVNLTAKTKVTATASGSIFIGAASGLGIGDLDIANGKGAKTLVSRTGSVNITGSAASFVAKGGNLVVQGAGSEGVHAIVGGTHSGSVAVKETGTVNIKTTVGALTLDASHGSLDVRGGHGDFSSGTTLVSGSHHAVATLTALAGVSLQAAGAVTMNAGNSVSLSAGFGYVANVNAQEGGTATLTRDSSLSVKAGTTLNVGAGSDIFILGGQANRILSDTFLSASGSNSRAGGKAAATLTAGVNMAAGGDVSIGAGSNLVIVAGAGNQLFVGTARIHGGFSGQRWNGGTATLSANTSVTVTAGRDLHLIAGGAGTGSLQVLGMANGGGSFNNQANVAGGSSSAVAKLTLIGNATLTAARDITIAAAGNASIVGGSLGNLRDDHATGKVNILGSADATLKAGRDVLLSGVTGSLTVAGVNVNSSHAGGILADVHASGGSGSVTAHGDANIIAGRNITTGSHSLAGLNVVGGEFVDAANLGFASNEHATATANAGLTAGGAITIKGTGDLNVLGGLFDSAAITNNSAPASLGGSSFAASGNRTATQSARATITATGAVTLSLKGDGVIAGGDSLTAKASMNGDNFETATATANTGVLIKGSSVSINVGGNLLTRAGSAVSAKAEGIGSDLKATATASADASITATGNVSITAGSVAGGDASFVGGSAGKGSALTLFSNNAATATAHADLNITAGKVLTITAVGNIKVAGGPGDENSALVVAGVPSNVFGSNSIGANSATATATVTSKVNFTAGTALSVTAGGNIDIFGGSRGGDSAVVSAIGGSSNGHKDHATLTLDQSVNMKAASVTLTANNGLGSVDINTFPPSASAAPPVNVSSSGAGNVAKATVNGSVTITSKTPVAINGTYMPSIGLGTTGASLGTGTYTNGNLTITDAIKVTGQRGTATAGFHPAGVRPQMVRLGTESLRLAPDEGTTSFGRIQSLGGASLTPAATQPEVIISGGIDLPAPAVTTLDTLQVQGLVPNLVTVTVAGDDSQQSKPASRTDEGATFQPDLTAADFVGSFPSSCTVLVVAQADRRCPAGGK